MDPPIDQSNDDTTIRKLTADDVEKEIENWLKTQYVTKPSNAEAKNFITLVEQKMKKYLSAIEISFIKRVYTEIVLKSWLGHSLENVSKNKMTDDIPTLIRDLNSLQSFQDIKSDQLVVFQWCKEYLDLILNQKELFEDGPFTDLVDNYFKEFKTVCVDQLRFQFFSGISEKGSKFISTLVKFLNHFNSHSCRQTILENKLIKKELEKEKIDGRLLIESLVDQFLGNETEPKDDWQMDCLIIKQLIKDLEESKDWTRLLLSQTNECCSKFLLPLVTYNEDVDGGRSTLIVQGSVIRISQIQSEMQRKMTESKVEQVKIVGLISVYIDSDLEQNIWHGRNVIVLTTKLFVDDKAVTWNLSGLDGSPSLIKPKNGQEFDGLAGEHGKPGESGGNVHVTCNEIINPGKWTIISNGGKGTCGQNGSNGQSVESSKDTEYDDNKPTQDQFQRLFGDLTSTKMTRALKYLKDLKTPISQVTIEDIDTGLAGNKSEPETKPKYFFQEISLANGVSTITASCYEKCSFVLWKGQKGQLKMGGKGGEGGKGGQGGYGGTITVQKRMNQDMLLLPGPQVDVVSTVSVHGESGLDGENGTGGRCELDRKSIGDVGYIDNLAENPPAGWKKGENYFGFDTHQHFKIQYYKEMPSEKFIAYTRCKWNDNDKYLAVLNCIDDWQNNHKEQNPITSTKGRQQQALEEAVRNKAITYQSLVHHLHQIDELNRTRQCLSKENEGQSITNIDEIVRLAAAKKRQSLLINLSSSSQVRYLNETHQNDSVVALFRKSTYSQDLLNNDGKKIRQPCTLDDKPVSLCWNNQSDMNQDDVKKMEDLSKKCNPDKFPANEYLENCLQQVSHYLEPKSTEPDENSILHATLGQKDRLSGLYKCDNIQQKIESIKAYLTKSPNTVDSKTIRDFVMQLSDDDTDLKQALQIREKYFHHIKTGMWEHIENKKKLVDPIAQMIEFTTPSSSIQDKINRLLSCCLNNKFTHLKTEDYRKNKIALKRIADNLNKGFDWENQFKGCENEYIRFIQSKPLGLSQLRQIVKSQSIIITATSHEKVGQRSQVINHSDDHLSKFGELTFNCDKKSFDISKTTTYIILLNKGQGLFQRLEIDSLIQNYCIRRILQIAKFRHNYNTSDQPILLDQLSTRRPIFAPTSLDLKAYRALIKWLKYKKTKEERNCWMNQVVTCVRILNPEYGCTPSELSRLLLKSLKNHDRMDEELAKDVVWLTERIVDYDSRNVDPIFYLSIVANLSPLGWKYEFLLLEMEECMQVVLGLEDRNKWRRNLYKLNDKFLPVLQERLCAARESSSSPKLDREKMGKTLEILVDQQVSWTIQDVDRLSQLALNDWFYELEMKMMQKEINQLSKGQAEATGQDVKEAVYILMELKNKRGKEFVQNLIKSPEIENRKWPDILENLKQISLKFDDGYSPTDSKEERNLENIINLIQKQKGNNTSTSIVNKMKTIQTSLEKITKLISDSGFASMSQCKKSNHIETAKIQLPLLKQKVQTNQTANQKDKKKKQIPMKDCKMENIEQFLYIYICAVQLTMEFWLSNAQRVTIMALLMDDKKTLAQVSTGEGKSLIVAAISIYRALFFDEKVDVITSNKVLAERDSSLTTDQGGLKDIYQLFKVQVAHNCSSDQGNRIKAYDSAVVYGELANFQRDYLLGIYYNQNIRGNRKFNCVVVDEVDCMLLDRGNNILYLTHDIPGMETLESLYVFIWEKIRDSTDGLDLIKSTVLFDLYGTITIDYLEHVCQDLKNPSEKKKLLWSFLINQEIIDQSGRLITNDDIQITQGKINSINYLQDPSLNPKLKFFFQNVLERERFIRIPQHLLSFVDRHLDTFLENAMKALMLNADEHYVVDHNRSSGRNHMSPQVIIIDPDTGTDLSTSQWDGGLHQFLQLKEGCQLTLQSLKSVFISNLTYITKYKSLSGLTGTLGSQPERDFLNQKYQCDYFTVPTAFQKKMTIMPANVAKSQDSWITAIRKETEQIVNQGRSLIIFCRSIKEVKDVYQHLKSRKKDLEPIKIECYTRDYEIFPYVSKKNPLDTRQVIVATNLAGRGTDIKLSKNLSQNGGLHICLTYLPGNIRIEEQAMGRAARQGDPGSGKLILWCQPDDVGTRIDQGDWPPGIIFDLKGERERQETLRISKLRQDFERIAKQEQSFESFWKLYKEKPLQTKLSNFDELTINSIHNSLLDQWALWLDQTDEGRTPDQENIDQLVKKFIKLIENKSEMEWMTPGRLIILAKQLIAEKKDLKIAAKWLDKLIKSKDSFLYPAAHYYRVLIYKNLDKNDGVNQKNRNQFILTLRTTQTILEQHIDIQQAFSLIVNHLRGRAEGKYNSLYFVDGYREQKENIVHILSHYINSIRSLLGSNCSLFDLQQVGIDDKKAKDYYDHLVQAGCILKCRVNDENTVPNRDKTLKEIAIRYGIKLEALEKFLQRINNLSQEEMKIKLESSGLIRYSRRKVWDLLVDQGVLFKPPSDQPDSTYDTILYDPTPENIKYLTERKKFCQSCLGRDVEWARIRMPCDTKTSKVDLTALFPAANDQQSLVLAQDPKPMDIETVDLTCFGKLSSPDDLIGANITDAEERESVWDELKKQILTQDASLRSDYQVGTAFDYPKCPVYQDAVMRLVEKTYHVELVRRQLLVKEQDPIHRMQWIDYLPIDPYQDLLDDLQAAHFISANRITDDKEIKLKEKIEEITQCQDERVRIFKLLENCQADYATAGCEFFLTSIRSDIQTTTEDNNTIDGIGAELYTFTLVGFNDVIRLSDKTRLWKLIKRNFFKIISSLATVGIGIGLLAITDPTGLTQLLLGILASEFVVRGVRRTTKILTSILSHYKDLPWTCHLRRLLKDPTIYSESLLRTVLLRIKNRGRLRVHIHSSNINRNTTEDRMTIVIDTMMKPQRSINIGMTIAWQRLDGQTEYLLTEKLGLYFHHLAKEISRKIETIVEEETIETIVNGNQEIDWVDSTQPWFNNLVTSIASITFDHNKETSRAEEQSNDIFKEVKKVLDTFRVFDVLVHLIENQIKRLSDDTLNNVTSQLKEKAEQMIELLKKSVLQEAVKHVDHPNVNRLQELAKERRSQWNERRVNIRMPANLSTAHIQTCLKLMKKTKDPSLLAALLRETNGDQFVVNDPFCMNGINKALEQVKDEQTKDELLSQSEKLAGKIDDDPSFAEAIRSGWRTYTQQTCPFQLYPVDGIGCTNTDCQLRGLNDYLGYRRFVNKKFQGESEADSFDNMRKHLINRRDNQSLIWLNIQTFMLPIAIRLSYNDVRRKDLVEAAEKHFLLYSAPRSIENGESSVISKTEADELTKRLCLYIG